MPAYELPGVAVGHRGARITGLVALALVVALLLAWRFVPTGSDPNRLAVSVLTDAVGEGIDKGSSVRLDGVNVGSIDEIESVGDGRQRIDMGLDKSQLFGLTDAVTIDYALGNLFGISEIELHPAAGGTPLRDGAVIDMSGPNSGRVHDATVSTLLGSLGQFTTEVLTPTLTEVLRKINIGAKAFTPLFQAIIDMVRAVADTQRLPSSFLLSQYGSAAAGLPSTVDGGVRLLDKIYTSEYMKSDTNRAKFDASVDMISNKFVPALVQTLTTAQPYLNGHTDMLAPLLDTIARSVSTPQQSGRELAVLLDRMGRKFHDTPDGPELDLAVELRGVPALSAPLLGGHGPAPKPRAGGR